MTAPLLQALSLKKHFPVYGGLLAGVKGQVKAVDDVSFEVRRGEILGLVGESGCGKTTLGRMTIRLVEPTAGKIFFEETEITGMSKKEMNRIRPRMQVIFQDPFSSLNPRFTVERIVGEAMLEHGLADRGQLRGRVEEILEKVGLSPRYMKRYPHEFSGGQRQRIGIARALALNPLYIVCDEPVSALDVSIQAQIVNLLQKVQREGDLSMLFISHDLNVVKRVSQRTAVMYLGKIVETAPTQALNENPAHPYTQALFAAKPAMDPKKRGRRIILGGDVPSPLNPPSGCHFHPRCPKVMDHCRKTYPQPVQIGESHAVQCHLYG
ncbi:MAG: ABC transporter ATP-binding protein [Nitrospinae bacterium]|nr:ABC transporter ATP-binding protein [Nitrospinota bacterium]